MIDNENWCPRCGGSAPIYSGDRIRLTLKYKGANGWDHKTIAISEHKDAIIGRLPECDFTVTDMCVSRKQFRILMKDNNVYVENLSKTNPTRINGVPFNEIRRLNNGDQLDVAKVFFIINFPCD